MNPIYKSEEEDESYYWNWNGFTNTNKQEYLGRWAQSLPPVAPADQHQVTQYITIPDSSKEVVLEHRALVTYRLWLDVFIDESPIKDAEDIAVTVLHRGTTYFYITRDGGVTREEALTTGRFYDEVIHDGGLGSSWAGNPLEDPMWDITAGDGFGANIDKVLYRRQYVMFFAEVLNAGTYQFGVVADIHHELGLVKVQNMTLEVEHVGDTIA